MRTILIALLGSSCTLLPAQVSVHTDSLRGSNTAYRNFWNVRKYDLEVEPNAENQSVSGKNTIHFTITRDTKNAVFQIDLKQPMQYRIEDSNFPIQSAKREGDFIFISTSTPFKKGEKGWLTLSFSGNPIMAKKSPWESGWVFSNDSKGKPFIGVAQEDMGASLWLPIKDIWEDEPEEGIITRVVTPKNLVGIGNGRLVSAQNRGDKKVWQWIVKNPINAYSIAPSVGDYVRFQDSFSGEGGKLDIDYWVLRENETKARKQFQQVKPMLKHLEYWFGKYPFYEDSYKLVETPFLGMEHQSNVAYGNGYQNGYMGTDLSQTGVGLQWDFIIVHETAHEWFANSITAKDKADMWIHEAFTSYAETLYTERLLNKADAQRYVIGTRHLIANDSPMEGKHGFWQSGSTDMYFKGANMIHMLRQMIDNDEKFRNILRKMNSLFYHTTITGKTVEEFWEKETGLSLKPFFQQYIRSTQIPTLEYKQSGNTIEYRLTNATDGLQFPLYIGDGIALSPTTAWQKTSLPPDVKFQPNANYLLEYKRVD